MAGAAAAAAAAASAYRDLLSKVDKLEASLLPRRTNADVARELRALRASVEAAGGTAAPVVGSGGDDAIARELRRTTEAYGLLSKELRAQKLTAAVEKRDLEAEIAKLRAAVRLRSRLDALRAWMATGNHEG
jgi:hypothetical protein